MWEAFLAIKFAIKTITAIKALGELEKNSNTGDTTVFINSKALWVKSSIALATRSYTLGSTVSANSPHLLKPCSWVALRNACLFSAIVSCATVLPKVSA